MGGYSQRVRDSILPLSVADTLPAAFAEWSFTENTVDHETPIETCELCGQQDLRYHFEIANPYTEAALWVGSHCILQFDVAVMENGTARFRKVTVTRDFGTSVEVRDGVKAGDQVILNPPVDLADGSKVQAKPMTPAASS